MASTTDPGPDHSRSSNDEPSGEPGDVVELDLPLDLRHASTVRLVAASLAADVGFTVDEIDDLRLGVNEAVSVLADVDAADGARLHLRFAATGRSMTVTVRRTGVSEVLALGEVDDLAVRILQAVVDEFRVDDGGSFVVVKHAVAADVD
jgi:serine/threonine-protein kinase RsbW